MAKVIGVQFQNNGKIYYFDPGNLEPHSGDYVIVNTERGDDLAEVVLEIFDFQPAEKDPPLKNVIRAATEQDIRAASDNRSKEKEAFVICQKKIQEHKLEMKLVSVEYAFDGNKILFYFTANGRVDFRSLVKDLASVFKTRIELRQIGVRDEARMIGGLGPCGRPMCCRAFLNDFQPVSIKMAKEQNLSLNPTKISGVCGRLMCCLKYEQDQYEQVRKRMPRVGKDGGTPDGTGTVTELNVVRETVSVRIANGDSSEIKTYPLDMITRNGNESKETQPVAAESEYTDTDLTAENKEEILALETEEMQENGNASVRTRQRRGRSSIGKTEQEKRPAKEDRKLGQPVKRENNRKNQPETSNGPRKDRKNKNLNEEKETEAVPPVSVPEEKKNPYEDAEKPSRPQNNWADQLKKAMQAIEHPGGN